MADKALVVGINRYPGCQLQGCVDDAGRMANFLVSKYGFRQDAIRLLTDERATADGIRSVIEGWLIDVAPGDRCFFHYSGHGAQMPTYSPALEVDGLDEVICPVDFNWSDAHAIRDKWFFQTFSRIPAGVKFCWASDSCHSGDLTRELLKHTPRAMRPPEDLAWDIAVGANVNIKKGLSRPRAISGGVLDVGFVSGCRSTQTSADTFMEGHPCGALTYFLIAALSAMPETTPLAQVVAAVNVAMSTHGYSQQPQCEGARAGLPFLG